ncbi:conserved hypothetical protein [Aeromonas salmonicida]|nr:conserved hypothetical protein [Aeromonas salmonicida]
MFQIGWLSRLDSPSSTRPMTSSRLTRGTLLAADQLDEIALFQVSLRPVNQCTRINHQENGWGTRIRT